jgi:hypothetical protein
MGKIIIGAIFIGHVKTQASQWIETKVFCFVIPLYIINTMLITDVEGRGRRGIEIKTNRTSIIAAIIRPIVTGICIVAVGGFIGNYGSRSWSWLIYPATISTALMIYCWFFFGRTTKREKFVRQQFGQVFGLYFMPEWLKAYEVKGKFEKAKKAYVSKFGTTDWKEKLKSMFYHDEDFSLAYCLTSLENSLAYNADSETLLKDITAQNIDKLA